MVLSMVGYSNIGVNRAGRLILARHRVLHGAHRRARR